jgi:hypothetical protein
MSTYNKIIRKMVVAFGNVFDDITLTRYNPNGTEQEHMKVPLAYASKERYVMRLESDPDLDKQVQMTLPRMSFELNGIKYDASRKQLTNIKNFAKSSNADTILSQYNPVPYDFDFSLFLYVRNIEDGTQIIEHILPFFTPDYTLKLNLIPEMGVIKEIPIVLKDTEYEVKYEGPREQETRTIIWTLNFTVKGFIFGAVSEPKIIKRSITNIYDDTILADTNIKFNMSQSGIGSYQEGEIVFQGYSLDSATATAVVLYWDPDISVLVVKDLIGNFVTSNPIYGRTTGSTRVLESYEITPQKLSQVTVTPDPYTANANSNYTYMVRTEVYPDIGDNENVITFDSSVNTMDQTTIKMDNSY